MNPACIRKSASCFNTASLTILTVLSFFLFDSGSLNATFGVSYGIGSVSGNAFRDNVIIGDAVAKGQIVGASNKTQGFTLVSPIDGICKSFPSYVLYLFFQTLTYLVFVIKLDHSGPRSFGEQCRRRIRLQFHPHLR